MSMALAWISGPKHANVFLCDVGARDPLVVTLKDITAGSCALILGDWRMQRPIVYAGSCRGEGLTADEVFATPSIKVVDPPLPPAHLRRCRGAATSYASLSTTPTEIRRWQRTCGGSRWTQRPARFRPHWPPPIPLLGAALQHPLLLRKARPGGLVGNDEVFSTGSLMQRGLDASFTVQYIF